MQFEYVGPFKQLTECSVRPAQQPIDHISADPSWHAHHIGLQNCVYHAGADKQRHNGERVPLCDVLQPLIQQNVRSGQMPGTMWSIGKVVGVIPRFHLTIANSCWSTIGGKDT